MLIESLIRTGQLLRDSQLPPQQQLRLICDADSPQVKNFFQHVFVVEITAEHAPVGLAMQIWGQEIQPDPDKAATVFQPDLNKAIAAPFVFPGANPVHPQGTYGIPVFPVFEKHFDAFQQNPAAIDQYLQGRLARCPSLSLTADQRHAITTELFARITQAPLQTKGKTLGLILLAQTVGPQAPYQYQPAYDDHAVGPSQIHPGSWLVPRLDRILPLYSQARYLEGRGAGKRTGDCSFSQPDAAAAAEDTQEVVSIYCKSWPWFGLAWNCPLSHAGKGSHVEGIALHRDAYEALNLGASYFGKLATPIDTIITRELFSPVADRQARRTVEHRSVGDLTTIYGGLLMLPVLDRDAIPPDQYQEFGENLRFRLYGVTSGPRLQRHLHQVCGFDASVPDDLDDTTYRLTLVYYSGDPSRGDIHLRCMIEDIVPSVVFRVQELVQATAAGVPALCAAAMPYASDKQIAWFETRYMLLPFLLARAYGGAYVWDRLQAVLRREPLDLSRPLANIAHRIASLTRQLPGSEHDIREEVLFYLAFTQFANRFHSTIAQGAPSAMSIRPWNELLTLVTESPPEAFNELNTNELGFACGVLIRQFSRQYWSVTKVGNEGKDFLKHRIMTFGTDLSPDAIVKKAIPAIFNLEIKLEKLHLSDDFRRRLGVLLNRCQDDQDPIRAQRDAFMVAFWSGYALQQTTKTNQAS